AQPTGAVPATRPTHSPPPMNPPRPMNTKDELTRIRESITLSTSRPLDAANGVALHREPHRPSGAEAERLHRRGRDSHDPRRLDARPGERAAQRRLGPRPLDRDDAGGVDVARPEA